MSSFVAWEGIVACNNACIVRSHARLDSALVCELPPDTAVSVAEEAETDGRRRLRISKPCDGWVTGKFVKRAVPVAWAEDGQQATVKQDDWKAQGEKTMFPNGNAQISAKTPMGKQVNYFGDEAGVDMSFASPHRVANDCLEMLMWIIREMTRFNTSLGDETKAMLTGSGSDNNGIEPGAAPHKSSRPKIIYIAGVEGTGHHGFMPLLLYPAVRKHGRAVFAWWRSMREVLLKTPPAERKAKLHKLLTAAKVGDAKGPQVIFEWCSYPFGEEHRERWAKGCEDPEALKREELSGNPGNSVDLREFVELFQEYGDVRVLVLHRGLISASWSHKEWDDGLVEHASIIALFNDYITGVVKGLSPDVWRWVSYEDFCQAHIRGDLAAIAPIADFLGIPRAALERSFKHFRPSRKDAAAEMPPASLQAIRRIDSEHCKDWFPALFPSQQLLAEVALAKPVAAPAPSGNANDLAEDTKKAMVRFLETLDDQQRRAWVALTEVKSQAEKAVKFKSFNDTLTEDQRLLFHKVGLREQETKTQRSAEVDPSVYTCLHMWLGSCGFGSEVNNLISAAIYCEENGLHCVVEDENWNSGRLHGYLQCDPFIRQRCPCEGSCRMLEVKRDKRVATTGWFVICKHGKQKVPFERKSAFTQQLWQLTPETDRRLTELNRELSLPPKYVAVQIRRGDKVAGKRRETLRVQTPDYARAALEHLRPSGPCSAVVVCTDDITAAEELADELRKARPKVDVRYRRRRETPDELRAGHWQPKWNAMPLERRMDHTHEFLADVEVMRNAHTLVCTFSSNVGRLVALLRDGRTISLDDDWSNT